MRAFLIRPKGHPTANAHPGVWFRARGDVMKAALLFALLVGCGGTTDASSPDAAPVCIGVVNPDGGTNSWTCNDGDTWTWEQASCPSCPPIPCNVTACERGAVCLVHDEWKGICQ